MINRRDTRQIYMGGVAIGGQAPISIQSMTSTPTIDTKATVDQIHRLEKAGCDIVRLGVPDMDSAKAIAIIRQEVNIPIVADIHFDYKLALEAVKSGVDGLRINPGNIKDSAKVQEIVRACKDNNLPIRIGVNSGSIDHTKYKHPTPEAMVESAYGHIRILEKLNFFDIKVSLKSSDVLTMIAANRLFVKSSDIPLHLGVTEAGGLEQALVKSAIGMGVLLNEGIGDTIRVSITGDVVKEIEAGRLILRSLGLRQEGVEIISCPTCARMEYDVETAVCEFTEKTRDFRGYIKVAIMGCIVNGPGEAREADLGVAVGKNGAVLFKKGEVLRKISKQGIVDELVAEVKNFGKTK